MLGAASGSGQGIPARSERDQEAGAASGSGQGIPARSERDQEAGAASGSGQGIPTRSERDQEAGAASGGIQEPAGSRFSSWYSASTLTDHTSWWAPKMFSTESMAVYIEWSWLL